MAGGVPLKYRDAPERPLANYDFTDLLTNTGYVTLYGLDTTAGDFLMSRQQLESTVAISSVTGLSGSLERNFDYQFLTSQLVKGDLYVSLTYGVVILASTATMDVTVEVFHYDGTTETTIGTQQSVTTINASASTTFRRETLKFAVNKMFKRNHKLRFEVIITHSAGNVNNSSFLYHDAADRNFSRTDQFGINASSTLKTVVPFDLGGKL